jgi:hypothetical protein
MTGAKRTPSLHSGLQSEQHALIERSGVADDLIVRAACDGVDRFAKRAQCALVRELDRHDHRDADGDAEDSQRGAGLLAQQRPQHERPHDHRVTRPSSTRTT